MNFKTYLQEFRSDKPQITPVSKELLSDWILDSELQHFAFTIGPGEKAIVTYKYTGFGREDIFFILTDRIKKTKDIVGYMWLNNRMTNGKFWQVRDVTIFPPYQNRGLGFNFYTKIIKEGYDLVNGYSLSTDIEKVWRKLHTQVDVNTYDLQTEEISEFDERPKEDDQDADDGQQYFWLARSKGQLKESLWHVGKDGILDSYFDGWINNDSRQVGSFCVDYFGEEGEF